MMKKKTKIKATFNEIEKIHHYDIDQLDRIKKNYDCGLIIKEWTCQTFYENDIHTNSLIH